ncbi:acylphosphatase [bacterium]|nr:MAG: acylphosphatase [bacterium]
MTDRRRIRAIVEGRVQGVGFRWFVMRAAEELDIFGWVKNRLDGTVETVAEGDSDAIDRFIGALLRGPASARVTNIDISEEEPGGEFTEFNLKY